MSGLWLLLLLAAARPEWVGEPLPIATSGRDLMLAVDVSGSMDYTDMQWQGQEVSRLDLVKGLVGEFISGRQGDRLGLILFGSNAYLQAPLTFDRQTVRTWLDEALIGIAGKNTAIGDAIGLAVKRLRERPAQSRVLVLVTDGANTAGQIEPLTAARLAAEEGVKIYTIGIGADPKASGIAGLLGMNPGLDLDEPQLTEIAGITGGRYFRARDAGELAEISQALDQLEPVAQQPQPRGLRRLHEDDVPGSQQRTDSIVGRLIRLDEQRLLAPRPFVLGAEVGKEIAETIQYATPNAAARALMDAAYLNNPAIFPPAEYIARCEPALYLGEEGERLRAEVWARIQAA